MPLIRRQIIATALLSLFMLAPSAWSAVTGEEIYKEVLEGTALYDDPGLDAYIKYLGAEMS